MPVARNLYEPDFLAVSLVFGERVEGLLLRVVNEELAPYVVGLEGAVFFLLPGAALWHNLSPAQNLRKTVDLGLVKSLIGLRTTTTKTKRTSMQAVKAVTTTHTYGSIYDMEVSETFKLHVAGVDEKHLHVRVHFVMHFRGS